MASVAAVVVSLAERHDLLVEALQSVHAQRCPVDDMVVGVDPRRLGEVANMNRLVGATDCEWLAFLHDDDLWHEDHIEMALPLIGADEWDIIVAQFRSVGRPQETFPLYPDDFNHLRRDNWFPPSVVVARKEVFGLWVKPERRWNGWVDWTNWNRLLDEGARFVYTGATTVDYRFGPWGNGSWNPP